VDYHDKRAVKKLPLKIVWGVSSLDGFKSTIKDGRGSLVTASIGSLGSFVGIGYDAVDGILIEINRGGG
jgi:hypothetical protein